MDNNITDNQNFNYFNSQYKKLKKSAVDSTVGLFRFNNPALRKHIKYELHQGKNNNSRHYGLMGNPVFEVLFPWQAQQKSILDFSGSLLHKDVAKMLKDSMPRPYEHQVESWQLLEENDPLKSLVITSGTGSGKTECFMVPIINDLVKSSEKGEPLVGVEALFLYPLNALINSQRDRLSKWTSALHKHDVRYCLYNGSTPETGGKSADKSVKEVKSREELRKNPPPILVTNATMLEYMLIRQNDAPIINASKKKLRWIVLDEAHSYTGSTAAELSLLLRRVMIAFEVDPKNIHFIATSATIGDDHEAQEKLKKFLASLAGVNLDQVRVINAKRDVPKLNSDLASPLESSFFLSQIMDIDPEAKVSPERYETLESHPFARKLRNCFITEREESYNTIPNDLNSLYEKLKDDIDSLIFKEKTKHPPLDYLLQWLDVCANTAYSDSEPAFLPLRGHFFQRTLSGLYACVNPHCSGKRGTHLESNEEDSNSWGFGYVYSSHLNSCEYCEYPVFELAFCNECQEPHLLTQKRQISGKDKYEQFTRFREDDFTVDIESSDSDDDSDLNEDNNQTSLYSPVLLMSTENISKNKENSDLNHLDNLTYNIFIDKKGFKKTRQTEGRQPIAEKKTDKDGYSSIHHCYACDNKHRKKPVISSTRLGGPFYISNAAPTLLEYCPATGGDDKSFQGRRMITFSDSRQGTARITMKLRQDSQRRTLRHIVYYEVAKKYSPPSQQEIQKIQESIKKAKSEYEKFKKLIEGSSMPFEGTTLEETARENIEKAKAKLKIQPPKLSWGKVKQEISQHTQFPFLKESFEKIATINKFKNDKEAIAEVLLLNEFAYRPKNANSLETMGLVNLDYPQLLKIKQNGFDLNNLGLQPNNGLKKELHKKFSQLELNDWRGYLRLLADFYVRDYRAVKIKEDYINALSTRYFNHTLLIEADDEIKIESKRIRKWLQVNPTQPDNSIRLIKLLAMTLDLDLHCDTTVSTVNHVLNKAFEDLCESKLLSPTSINGIQGYALEFKNINLSIPDKIWVCPITRRILPCTFKGYTPYLPRNANLSALQLSKDRYLCTPYEMSVYKPKPGKASFKADAKQWLEYNKSIQNLKEQSLWTDLSDDVILGANALITEEHSAQLDSDILGKYEDKFKAGEINILNCSTTMEMGVDIGGISAVAMNNVPPHPANYLQRTGRAGRSRENTATSFTICKDNPHEQMVFDNTSWAFDTKIEPPYITLTSKRIVQRHINAYLMSHFLPSLIETSLVNQSAIILNSGWFFFNWQADRKNIKDETKPMRFEDIEGKVLSISKKIQNKVADKSNEIPGQKNNEYIYLEIINLLSDKAPVNILIKKLHNLKFLNTEKLEKLGISNNISRIKKLSALNSVSLNDILDSSINDLKKAQQYVNDKVASRIEEYLRFKDGKQNKGSNYLNKLIFDIRGVASGYLLSDLARHNFLPRYGFPSGLIEFDLYSQYVVSKKPKDENSNSKKSNNYNNYTESTESLLISNNKPVRDISVAIREYAPGNEVVIDGLVYKSAGLELSRYYNHSNSNDAQKIDRFARCNQCGSMHEYTNLDNPLACVDCDEIIPISNISNFVEPMGFRVDYFTAPHNSIENQTYVPVEEPMVQANGDMYPLISPDVGSFRIDSDGVIFQQSKGVYGNGYLICLSCGRAESSRFKPSDGKRFQMQKDNFLKHVPMKPLSKGMVAKEDMKSGACNSNNSGASVQHLYIGSVDQTNVFEIYLKDPDSDFDNYMGSDEHKTIISTLAVAFRDALAMCHGITREELGFSIKQVGIEQKKSWAISIYDKASGGAGFSSTANQYLNQIFDIALDILSCDECDSACHSCLLSYDTRFISKDLNRVQALEYLNKIKGFMKLPDSAASLLPNAVFCYQDIESTLAQSITSGFSEVWVYMQGEAKSWALAESLIGKVNRWSHSDISINIVFSAKELNNIDNITKLQLLQLKSLDNVEILTYDSDSELLTNNYLLQIARYNSNNIVDEVLTLATTDKKAYIPNAEFWKIELDEFIVLAYDEDLLSTTELLSPIDDKQLVLDPQHNTYKRAFENELNVHSDEFGSKFWQLMRDYEQLNDYLNSLTELTKIEYMDPYVRSPFITIILGHILYSLKSLYAEKWSNPEVLINTSFDFDNHKANKGNKPSKQYKLTHSWSDETQQKEVQAQFFAKTLELQEGRCEVNLSNKSNLQHHRSLTLYWTDNTKTIITLDHGFGFIKLNSDIYEELRFIYKKDLNEQVEQLKKLMEIKTQLTTDSGKEHIIYLEHCIENRHD